MAVIALTHATGAPGTTTSALGLTMYWPRPVILIEADLSGASIPAGYKRGEWDLSRGLTSLAVAQYQSPDQWSLRDHALPLADHAEVLLGIPSSAAAKSVRTLWPILITALRSLDESGVDVIVDLGRLTPEPDDRDALLTGADLHLLVTGTRLPDVYAARHHARRLAAHQPVADSGLTGTSLLPVGPGRPYATREVTKVTGLSAVAEVPWEPVTAEVYSVGAPPGRKHATSSLVRAYEAAGVHIRTQIESNERLLQGGMAR